MDITTRQDYFKYKQKYVILFSILQILRIVGLIVSALVLIVCVWVAMDVNSFNINVMDFNKLCDITKYILPYFYLLWIAYSIPVRIFKKKLIESKKKAGVIDEI